MELNKWAQEVDAGWDLQVIIADLDLLAAVQDSDLPVAAQVSDLPVVTDSDLLVVARVSDLPALMKDTHLRAIVRDWDRLAVRDMDLWMLRDLDHPVVRDKDLPVDRGLGLRVARDSDLPVVHRDIGLDRILTTPIEHRQEQLINFAGMNGYNSWLTTILGRSDMKAVKVLLPITLVTLIAGVTTDGIMAQAARRARVRAAARDTTVIKTPETTETRQDAHQENQESRQERRDQASPNQKAATYNVAKSKHQEKLTNQAKAAEALSQRKTLRLIGR